MNSKILHMVNDTISDMLTRLRNASLVKKRTVVVPLTQLNLRIAEICEKEGFIHSFELLGTQPSTELKSNMNTNGESAISGQEKRGSINVLKSEFKKTKEFKIHLKYYKKFKTKYYKLTRIQNPVCFSMFKNLIKLLRRKQSHQKVSCITNVRRISKPGLRIYSNSKELPRVLGGAGIVILSTSSGIMTDREARFRGIGGEVLCSIW